MYFLYVLPPWVVREFACPSIDVLLVGKEVNVNSRQFIKEVRLCVVGCESCW